jgi:hypothetical protein
MLPPRQEIDPIDKKEHNEKDKRKWVKSKTNRKH